MRVEERFLKYVKIDTQSNSETGKVPSTPGQLELAAELVKELHEIGVQDAHLVEDTGCVYGTIPASEGCGHLPVMGLLAHMDTAEEMSGHDVKPRLIQNYDGGDVVLNEKLGIVLTTAEFDDLPGLKGQDLIVTDGTTLLGADDKAGVAEIMTVAEVLMSDPSRKHGKIRIAFTPDEEIGQGVDHFDVEGFGADYAYTLDGGPVNEIEYENFNAASGHITVHGKNIHPGSAKGKMVNAMLIAMEFQGMLDPLETPQNTEGYEGFIHLVYMDGSVEEAHLSYIIRDHDADKIEKKKAKMQAIERYLNEKYGEGTVVADVKDEYRNMKEMILPHFEIVENAYKAIEALGMVPASVAIRGGTDGANLSYMGLPCPNLGTGGNGAHGRFEHITVQAMEQMVELVLKLVELQAQA